MQDKSVRQVMSHQSSRVAVQDRSFRPVVSRQSFGSASGVSAGQVSQTSHVTSVESSRSAGQVIQTGRVTSVIWVGVGCECRTSRSDESCHISRVESVQDKSSGRVVAHQSFESASKGGFAVGQADAGQQRVLLEPYHWGAHCILGWSEARLTGWVGDSARQ